jgi:hypothetical protein
MQPACGQLLNELFMSTTQQGDFTGKVAFVTASARALAALWRSATMNALGSLAKALQLPLVLLMTFPEQES